MKVVLFCGGLGTRLRQFHDDVPKPMVNIGCRPILWHIMKYYSYFGHKQFILCLGYKGEKIKDYFLNYKEYVSNDFTFSCGGKQIEFENTDIDDWMITFVDTGLRANIGQRLLYVRKYVEGDDMFLANYADGLTDLPLPVQIDAFRKSGKVACVLCVRPSQSFHVVTVNNQDEIQDIQYVRNTGILINGGFFVFRKEIFNYVRDGEELVEEPFRRLINEGQLMGYRYQNYWCMDTFKEQQELTDMYNSGNAPWEVWKSVPGPRADDAARRPLAAR